MLNWKGITRKPSFWIFQVLVFLFCSALAFRLYPMAFPMVNLEIKMDRSAALKAAAQLATDHQWVPKNFKQAARFELDDELQTFVELTGGGSPAFAKVLREGIYFPYTWKIRNYMEGNPNETVIRFTPEGKFYAFGEKIPETEPGAALGVPEAQVIAETGARKFGVDLSQFELIEKSQEIKLSGRIDHIFVYERPQARLGEGRYRLILGVAGDHLVRLSHHVKIPDSFSRKYAEMRSFNDTIAVISTAAIAILYFLGACVFGLFFLSKIHWVQWRAPFLFALIVAGFQFLEQLNHLPLIWMDYDTALSSIGFLVRHLSSSVVMVMFEVILLTVSFAAAESLSRKAFPHHPQLWRIWTLRNASSYQILGRTVGGYLALGFFFFYIVAVYIVGTKYLGWWSPSDSLFHPDVLATYCPWFTSISNSLHAGFWEESLFRAVPLASAALLGTRFGGRKKWIVLGMILQALVFASAHANYPAQPSYARVVELIFPSLVFGGLYLAFGLLPGILLHFIFDTVSFALPLFAVTTSGIWVQRGMVVICALIPVWIVLFARWRVGKWVSLPESERNQMWKPVPQSQQSNRQSNQKSSFIEHQDMQLGTSLETRLGSRKKTRWVLLLVSWAVLGWLFLLPMENLNPRLGVSRDEAIAIARKGLDQAGYHLGDTWEAGAYIADSWDLEDDFVWKTGGFREFKRFVGSYLAPTGWVVRFFRFDTDVAERAEEYQVSIFRSGEIYRIRHEVPEGRVLQSLSNDQARQLALASLQKAYGLSSSALKELSSAPSKLPARTDWYFVFLDPSAPLRQGQARLGVHVVGQEVASIRRFIFVPEAWTREERNRRNLEGIVRGIAVLSVTLILLIGLILSLKRWVQHTASFKDLWGWFGITFILELIIFTNGLPSRLAQFSTQSPRLNQSITLFALGLIKVLFVSGSLALMMGYLRQILRRQPPLRTWIDVRMGYGMGILVGFLLICGSQFLPPPSPRLGKMEPLNDWVSVFYGFQIVETYFGMVLLFGFVGDWLQKLTQGWRVKRGWGAFFLMTLGFVMSGIQMNDLAHGWVMGIGLGITLIAGYSLILKTSLNLIPQVVAGMFIVSALKELKLNAFVGSFWVWGFALILILGTSGFLAFYPVSSSSSSLKE